MEFCALHFGDKLTVINPSGNTGVVTLWSKPSWAMEKLKTWGIDMSHSGSPVAVMGNLYGNGLPELLRNLLYNPQITKLLICGRDLSGSGAELVSFFRKGLVKVDFLGREATCIAGTNRMIDSMVKREDFGDRIAVFDAGMLEGDTPPESLISFMATTLKPEDENMQRVKRELPKADTVTFPSNPRGHDICEDDALEAYRHLIFRLRRFGVTAHLRKGDRIELQNVRITVNRPDFVEDDRLSAYGFEPAGFARYYDNFLDTALDGDSSTYTYGNRLGAYFRLDTIAAAAENLKLDPEDRKSYVSLWDTSKDLTSKSGHPCLVSLYFRKYQGFLTLTATFRTHNALDAWLKNFYGLMRVQREVCRMTGMEGGPITVISHSISLDPRRLEAASAIAGKISRRMKEDPNGNFSISTENGEIVVDHYHRGIHLATYRDSSPIRLQHKLASDFAVSDTSHAIYLGRMLEKARQCIDGGVEFVQK